MQVLGCRSDVPSDLPVATRKISLFASFRIQSNPLESKAKPTNIGIILSQGRDVIQPRRLIVCL